MTPQKRLKETLIKSDPFGLSLSKPLFVKVVPFDKLRANGINQCFPRVTIRPYETNIGAMARFVLRVLRVLPVPPAS